MKKFIWRYLVFWLWAWFFAESHLQTTIGNELGWKITFYTLWYIGIVGCVWVVDKLVGD